jgi:two-component sensor histidine kinase
MRIGPLQQHFRTRLRKRMPWVIVLVFAALITGLQFVIAPGATHARHTGVMVNILVMPLVTSFCYGFLTPLPWRWTGDDRLRAPFWRGLTQSLVFNALVVLLLVTLSWLMVRNANLKAEALGLAQGAKATFRTVLMVQMLAGVPMMTIIGAIISFAVVTEEEKATAEARLEEAQWVLLRGQLSPHVLFNSLNGLAELVRQDPVAAEQAILDLSELYRALLRHGDRARAPLAEERALVQRFLAVEGLRLGDRLKVRWDWDVGLNQAEAPPFLIQPLVENALKHGIAPHPEGGTLEISLRRHNGGLVLRVSNTGRGLGLVPGAGVGLANLEARLRLAYGAGATLHLRSEGPRTVATVEVPSLEMRR